jgi:hypothetical protein
MRADAVLRDLNIEAPVAMRIARLAVADDRIELAFPRTPNAMS